MSVRDPSTATLEEVAQRLVASLRAYGRCAVALSGGVDSAVVARAAVEALGPAAIAYTGVGASVSAEELAAAKDAAEQIQIRHVLIDVDEIHSPDYVRNGPDRCYYCKSELYDRIARGTDDEVVIVNGTNADDLGDHRPGLRAAAERTVCSPLAECGVDKSLVRSLARHWGLAVAEKPAAPCLASRIAYGTEVTPERLARIEQAERRLRQMGFPLLRVRLHDGELARIEVPAADLARLAASPLREEIADAFLAIGFRYVTLDLQGFRSGSLNAIVPVEALEQSASRR